MIAIAAIALIILAIILVFRLSGPSPHTEMPPTQGQSTY